MQFQVPQFIDVEDKIFGPLSFKQFLYLAGGTGACFVIYTLLPIFLAAPLIIAIGGLAGALAFYKINNRPFINVLEAAFRYVFSPRLYLWKREERKAIQKKEELPPTPVSVARLSESKLKELSWSLDIKKDAKNQ